MAHIIQFIILASSGLFVRIKGQQLDIEELRLVGGNATAGRVEVLVRGNASWGTVCDYFWDDQDAQVVCRTLGLRGGVALGNANYGPGSGPIWIERVSCVGDEIHFRYCSFLDDRNYTCQHNQDAGVMCQSPGGATTTAAPTATTTAALTTTTTAAPTATTSAAPTISISQPGCSQNLTAPTGEISSPNFPSPYPLNANCSFYIRVPSGPITLTFTTLDLECDYDFVQVREGDGTDLGTFCSLDSVQPLTTAGNSLLVIFTSAGDPPFTGFRATYTSGGGPQSSTAILTVASSAAATATFTTPFATQSTSTAATTTAIPSYISTPVTTTSFTSSATQTTSVTNATTSKGSQRSVCPKDGSWVETPAGHTMDIPCPEGYPPGQNRFRTCSFGGEWLPPNTSACVRQELRLLQDAARQLQDGTGNASTAEVSQMLSSATSNASVLQVGDLITSVSVMRILAALSDNINGSAAPSRDVLQDVVQSADNLLQAEEIWVDQTKSAFGLMEALDVLAKSVSKGLNTSEPPPVITKKIVIVVGSSDIGQTSIVFPKPRNEPSAQQFPDWLKNSKSSVFLDQGSLPPDVRNVSYSVAMYNNISSIFSRTVHSKLTGSNSSAQQEQSELVVNSPIIALSVSVSRPLLRDVKLTFEHLTSNFSETFCRYLDFQDGAAGRWSGDGCRRVDEESSSLVTVCSCDHLTNFALLMSPYRPTGVIVEVLTIFTIFGCAVSIFFLVITLFIYFICWENLTKDRHSISTTRTKILVNLCVILIIAYVIFLAGVNRTEDKAGCRAVSVILHYVWLVAFFLMLSEGVHIFISIIIVFPQKSIFTWLMLCSYGVPVVIVVVTLGVTQLEGYGGAHSCWLSLDKGVLWAFVGPALGTLLANFVFVALVVRTLMMSKTMMSKSKRDQTKAIVKAICVMSPVLGLTWVFGVLGVNEETVSFQVLFVIFNSMQGFLIFVFHCLLAKPVRDVLLKKTRKYSLSKLHDSNTGTKSTSAVYAQKVTNQDSESEHYNTRTVVMVSPLAMANDYTELPIMLADKEVVHSAAQEEVKGQGQTEAAFVNFAYSTGDNSPNKLMLISTNASTNMTVSESISSTADTVDIQ